MAIFVAADGYDELTCKQLLHKKLDWSDAIENANPVALRQSALSLSKSINSTDQAGEIYKLLYMAVQGGDELAAITLANFLLEGKLFAKDTETANQLISQLVENNDATANLLLARTLLYPGESIEIVPKSPEAANRAFMLLTTAANTGLADAQYLLARLYHPVEYS